MTFKEWIELLTPTREQTTGEDIADSIGLAIIMAMVVMVIFL